MIVRTHVRRLAAIAAAVVAIVVVATASATAGERLADLLAGDQRVGPYGEIYQRDGTVLLRGDVTNKLRWK